MQNHPLIVEGVLLRNSVGCDLIENRFLQKVRAKVPPDLCLSQFWIEGARRPKTNRLADQVIAALGAGVTEGLRGAPGVSCDHGDEQSDAIVGCGGRMNESMQRERPGENAQGALLSANPERTGHRRAVASPVFNRAPESLREALVAA